MVILGVLMLIGAALLGFTLVGILTALVLTVSVAGMTALSSRGSHASAWSGPLDRLGLSRRPPRRSEVPPPSSHRARHVITSADPDALQNLRLILSEAGLRPGGVVLLDVSAVPAHPSTAPFWALIFAAAERQQLHGGALHVVGAPSRLARRPAPPAPARLSPPHTDPGARGVRRPEGCGKGGPALGRQEWGRGHLEDAQR